MAGLQAQYFGGSATLPAGTNAETGVVFSREDSKTGTTPVPVPVPPGVNFSFLKVLALAITATDATTISNRTIQLVGALAAGIGLHWKTDTQAHWAAAFDQTGGSKAPADTLGTNNAGVAPAGYTALTTSPVQYDNTAQSASSTGIDGILLLGLLLATDATNNSPPGTSALGNGIFGYDDA